MKFEGAEVLDAVLAWWLRQDTTVSLAWLSERLGMGHVSRVSQAGSQMKRHPGRGGRQAPTLAGARAGGRGKSRMRRCECKVYGTWQLCKGLILDELVRKGIAFLGNEEQIS